MFSGWVSVCVSTFSDLNLLYVVTNLKFMSPVGRKTCDQWKAAFAAKDQGSSQGLWEIITPLDSLLFTLLLRHLNSMFSSHYIGICSFNSDFALLLSLLAIVFFLVWLSLLSYWIESLIVNFKIRVDFLFLARNPTARPKNHQRHSCCWIMGQRYSWILTYFFAFLRRQTIFIQYILIFSLFKFQFWGLISQERHSMLSSSLSRELRKKLRPR